MTELPSATVIAGVANDAAACAADPPGATAARPVMAMAMTLATASILTPDLTAITRRPVPAAFAIPAASGPDGTAAMTRRRAIARGPAPQSFMVSPDVRNGPDQASMTRALKRRHK